MKKTTVCLNMIVKDESHVIRRCLMSVRRLIDYWVIVDTGSTDGTQSLVREILRDIPGELHERPWVNFGHNRNEALALARGKADYFLFTDADDRLVFSDDFSMPAFDKDYYYVLQLIKHLSPHTFTTNQRVLLIKDLPDFQWSGPLHEILLCDPSRSYSLLTGVVDEYLHDGNRSKDPERYKKDVQMLETAYREDPSNSRNVFYLAQTYMGLEDNATALRFYEKRSSMGGREDEVFFSLFCIACLQKALNYSSEVYYKSFCNAYLFRPSRAEPLFQMAGCLMESENYLTAYLLLKLALSNPPPPPLDLYLQNWVYEWGLLWHYYHCSLRLGKMAQAQKIRVKLLAIPTLPPDQRRQLEARAR